MAAADEGRHQHKSHHFLVVALGAQSHVNPGRILAHRLTQLGHGLGGVDGCGSVLATLSLPIPTHRRMFPSLNSDDTEETTDGVISYAPYSDDVDDGSMPRSAEDRARRRRASSASLSALVARLAARGRPVTCVVCTMVLPPALDVARERGLPLAVYWIQSATVLGVTYHYFRGYGELIAARAADGPDAEVSLPGLCRRLRARDLPTFYVDAAGSELSRAINAMSRELFGNKSLDDDDDDDWRPKVLVNTFRELEPDVLAEMARRLDVFAVGPMVGSPAEERIHLFQHGDAEKERYMGWLGAQLERSVVYASFGSLSRHAKRQMEEVARGLLQCARPFLLVVRRDGLEEGDAIAMHCLETAAQQNQGIVVDWCDQLEVLSHPAVGCFVSHCGWNSTMEAVVSGVPVVAVLNTLDQTTNAYLVEEWGVGVRGERNREGVLTGVELERYIELVMCRGAKAMAMRERAKALKERARQAAGAGGTAERNLQEFLNTVFQPRGNVSSAVPVESLSKS